MSRLDELIKELCPDGVEWHTIDDISLFVTVGIANSATHAYSNSGVIMFRNQNINPNYLNDNDLIFITDDFSEKYKNKKLKENDILVTRTGYPGQACVVPKKYEGCQTFTTLIVRLRNFNETLPEYVCQYINSGFGKEYVDKTKSGAAQQNFGATSLAKMSIPIPPIEVQREIVKILDAYSESVSSLQRELEKELTARKKQYEYYRDFLLEFSFKEATADLCVWEKLGDVCEIGDGLHGTPLYQEDTGYYFVNGNNLKNGRIIIFDNTKEVSKISYNKNHIEFNENTIFMSINGTIGNLAIYNNENIILGKSAAYFKPVSSKLLSKFLYYLLQTRTSLEYFTNSLTGSTIKNLGLKALREYNIPVPPIETQEHIVSLFERLDKLCKDISEKLPAEIEARQKQYEYYRDKLLTFKEKKEA